MSAPMLYFVTYIFLNSVKTTTTITTTKWLHSIPGLSEMLKYQEKLRALLLHNRNFTKSQVVFKIFVVVVLFMDSSPAVRWRVRSIFRN